ncbi:hypothetical protein ASD78_01215 [Lysobacter sp. Root667]|uniref:DUF3106 domain-containing protein n=1 Tax=Lysobacter sp. Root667 TaxID=1736581 RepID=UPI000700DE4E|nr:DUF3106 domain-containing protein [Lysobacter sp. Root667]KRA81922.1 hypothetical protein ASD78_01215 [Lysobacter sp. Root667]
MPRAERARRRLRLGIAAAAGLLLAGALGAAAAQTLPPEYAAIAERLPAQARARLQANAAQWAGWSAEQRAAFNARAVAWHALPAAERAARRERYAAWLALPADERASAQAAAARYAALPPEQQQALRARFDALDRSLRRGWLLGPTLGLDYAALQPLLAQLPPEQHAPMLRVLRELSAQQRKDLAVLVQRTPPQGREALRRELLATRWDEREGWFWHKLRQ